MARPARHINGSSPGEQRPARAPRLVALVNPLARRLLRGGIPLGPNALLTVRGRSSGLDRTTPVAVVAIDGRRWVIATFGDTNWARNLRAAGRAVLTVNRRAQPVSARELPTTDAEAFYRGTLAPFVNKIPLGLGRFMLGSVLGAAEMLTDPQAAARRHPVFELDPLTASSGSAADAAPQAG